MVNLGSTGQFPEGKLNQDDEGELVFAVGLNDHHVVMEFGKPVSWIAMHPEQAERLGRALIEQAARMKGAH